MEQGAPPNVDSSTGRCHPTLLLSLPPWITSELGHVLRNDLAFSTASSWNRNLPGELRLKTLQYMNGNELINLTKSHGGSTILSEDDLYDARTGQFAVDKLQELQGKTFQAIVVDDSSILNEPIIQDFIRDQYMNRAVSVVVMGVEGVFDLSPLEAILGVDWRCTSYTSRTVALTNLGQRIISNAAFPENRYCKALFVTSPSRSQEEELFVEYINPKDYEDDSDYEDGPPPPGPGSPVIVHVDDHEPQDRRRAVSYFGFVNSLDVCYGAIILRLCYAAEHAQENHAE